MNAVLDEASLRPVPRDHTSRWAARFAFGGAGALSVVAALVGVAAAVDPGGARPFTSLRWAVVSVGMCAAAVLSPRWNLPRWQAVVWTILVGAMAAGAAAGPDPMTAWLGHPQRHLGVLAWVVFALAFVGGAAIASGGGAVRRTIELAAVVVAGNVVVTSIADLLGWDPAGSSFADDRIGGVFGQPVALATVAVLLLPIVSVCRRVGWVRWPIAAGLLLVIGASQTRGAVVGLAAAAAVTAPRWWPAVKFASVRTRRLAGALIGVALVLLAVSPFGQRLADGIDSSRPDDWRLGAAVVADNPVVGVGPEGYRIAVLEHLGDEYVAEYGRDVIVDRAHSAPLDVAASGGLVAGAAYLVLVGGVVLATWRCARRAATTDAQRFAMAAGAGAVGVFGAGLAAFPVAEIDAVAWLFGGVAVAAAAGQGWGSAGGRAVAVGRVGAGVVLVVATIAGVTDVMADHRMEDALAAAATGRTTRAVAEAERAVALRPDLVDAHYTAATAAASGPTILDLDRAIDFAATGLDRFPRDPALRDLHARLLVDRAVRSGLDSDTAAATDALAALTADDPTSLVAESGTRRLVEACLIRCENKP